MERHSDVQGSGRADLLRHAARDLHARWRDPRPGQVLRHLLEKVRQTPEWKEFIERGAFNQTAIAGKEYADWVAKNEQLHMGLMKDAGFLAAK